MSAMPSSVLSSSSASRAAGRPRAWDRLRLVWAGLAVRERFMAGGAAVLVLLALLWWVAISPALDTLRTADTRHRVLDAELQTMRRLAAEAAVLQAQPRIKADDSRRALDQSVKQRLGASAQVLVAGERATVTLKDTPPDALVQWLSQVRTNAGALPTDARLTQNAARTGWDGTVVLALPPP